MDLNLPKHYLLWALTYRRGRLARKCFQLGGTRYRYFIHPYNHTWNNERVVELPPVLRIIREYRPTQILEIGCVLPHYITAEHDVIDRDERMLLHPTIRTDIVTYASTRRYDLIVSVSTLEHVGWDEDPRAREKVLLAIEKIRSLLTPDGRALITLPIGYNRFLDERLRENGGLFDRLSCLMRRTEENEWEECDLETALACVYGAPFRNANAVVFAELLGVEKGES